MARKECLGEIVGIGNKRSTITLSTQLSGEIEFSNSFTNLPFEIGDRVYLNFLKDQKNTILRPPFVKVGRSREVVLDCLSRALTKVGVGKGRIEDIYVHILTGGDVADALDKASDDLHLGLGRSGHQILSEVLESRQQQSLLHWWIKHRLERQLSLFGLTPKEIYEFKNESLLEVIKQCQENPFRLIGLSLERCDEMLRLQNKKLDATERICGAAIRYIHKMHHDGGHMCSPRSYLEKKIEGVEVLWDKLKEDYGIIEEFGCIYLPIQHRIETTLSHVLTVFATRPWDDDPGEKPESQRVISYTNAGLTDQQELAIKTALLSPCTVISGAAGTGKTYVIRELCDILERWKEPYVLASFTGKAVARIREVTQRKEATTLHRLLKTGSRKFKWLIIDESSMLDDGLMYAVFTKFGTGFKPVFIGDSSQLSPISPGTFFEQIIKCGKFPVVTLDIVHRQKTEDDIILENASRMIQPGAFHFTVGSNLRFLEHTDPHGTVTSFVEMMKRKGVSQDEWAIIVAYNRDLAMINEICSTIYHGDEETTEWRGITYRLGDKMMNLQNNVELGLFNGSQGFITEVMPDAIMVMFQDEGVSHRFRFVDDGQNEGDSSDSEDELRISSVTKCYALTVDKSQGSEMKYVVFYLPHIDTNSSFLNKNRIYTALTRTSHLFLAIADQEALEKAASRPKPNRYENLAKRITLEAV